MYELHADTPKLHAELVNNTTSIGLEVQLKDLTTHTPMYVHYAGTQARMYVTGADTRAQYTPMHNARMITYTPTPTPSTCIMHTYVTRAHDTHMHTYNVHTHYARDPDELSYFVNFRLFAKLSLFSTKPEFLDLTDFTVEFPVVNWDFWPIMYPCTRLHIWAHYAGA